MNERLLLIDGSLLLFQMFYGMPNKIYSKQFKHSWSIHGIIGFIGGVLKTIKIVKPTHLAIIFDGEIVNERQEDDALYKANRPNFHDVSDDENPFLGLTYIYQCLEYMGIYYHEMTELESDDYIAFLAKKAIEKKQCHVVISSKDKDFYQLINERITVFNYAGKKSVFLDEAAIKLRYGIKPSQMGDFKALYGDSSDNIKKVAGCGLVTTKMLINTFNDIDTLFQNLEQVSNVRLRQNLIDAKERVYNNKKLISFREHQDWHFTISRYQINEEVSNLTTTEVLVACGIW